MNDWKELTNNPPYDRVKKLEEDVSKCLEDIASLRSTIAAQKSMLHDKDVEIRTLRSIIKG